MKRTEDELARITKQLKQIESNTPGGASGYYGPTAGYGRGNMSNTLKVD
jgi:hypothetical protein